MKELLQILEQISKLSGVALKAVSQAVGGGGQQHGGAPEGSPQEEAGESPAKESWEQHNAEESGPKPPQHQYAPGQ